MSDGKRREPSEEDVELLAADLEAWYALMTDRAELLLGLSEDDPDAKERALERVCLGLMGAALEVLRGAGCTREFAVALVMDRVKRWD